MEIEDLLERQDIPKDVIKAIQQSLDNSRQIEEKLRESEEQYRNVVERANDGIVIVQDSLIKYVNPCLIKITGYTVDDLHNTPFINYIHPDFRSEVLNRYEKRMARLNVSSIYETVFLLKNDKTLEVEINAGLITYQGKPADLAIIRDLTKRKYADQALKESEARNRAILSAIPDLMFQINKDGKFVAYSGPRDELYTTPEEFLGKNVHDVLPKDLAEQTMHFIEVTFQTQESQIFEYQLQVQDKFHHYECRMTQCGEDEVLSIVRDVSEKKLAEHALKESEEKYRILFDESPDSIAIVGLDGIIQDCNKAAAGISSTTMEKMIGKSYFELDMLMEEDIPNYVDFFSKFLNGSDIKTFESKIKLKNNEIKHFEVFPTFIKKDDEILAIQVISRDNTEHKRAEEELRKSKEKYQMLVEKLEEGVLLEDGQGNISFINPKTAELLGYTEKELLGQHWRYIVPEEDLDSITSEASKRPKGLGTTYEASLLAKNGHTIPVIITATPIFSHNGDFEGVLSVFTDITDRKAVEQKLRESEEQYRSYVEYARDIIFSISFDGIITSLNPVMESITGWKPEEWIGKPFLPLVHEEDLPLILEAAQNILNRKRFPAVEMRMLKKSGDYVAVEIKASAQMQAGEVTGMLGIARNISERKQAEEALRQVKLEEERYHAMMSHFVNNDMQKIINNLELVLLMYESNLELNSNIVNKVITIASDSSKTIDMVNHIFEILQTPFIPKDGINFLDVIKDVISEFSDYSPHINIDKMNLDSMMIVDTHLKDALYELLVFILNSFDRGIDATIDITGSFLPSFYCVYISDCSSEPLTQDVVSQLSGQITDEWEVIGHHIGIALASVIMQYYGGVLKIKSSDPKGNVFELRFPKELIEAETIELKE